MDRVDLQRFPAVSAAAPLFANLTAGDALYIPDGWWHVVHSPKGRNVRRTAAPNASTAAAAAMEL